MFSELPKLFDRNFTIGYFLPVSLFIAASAFLWGYWSKIQTVLTGNASLEAALIVFDATLIVLTAWIIGVLFMVLNREIYRILEGYGNLNPLRLLQGRVESEFRKKRDRLRWLDNEYSKQSFTEKLRKERNTLMKELANNYPDHEDLLLSTAFGNTIRAFEIYPRVMYGMEGIEGWSRILAVVPREYRELIDDAKGQVDWWVNIGVMSFCFLFEVWLFIFSTWGLSPGWLYTMFNIFIPLGVWIILNHFVLSRATSAAIGWGEYVKSAFDLYRFNLLQSIGIDGPKNRAEEKLSWKKFSQAIIYRLPDTLPDVKENNGNPATRKTS
jgi:hypothetical protein